MRQRPKAFLSAGRVFRSQTRSHRLHQGGARYRFRHYPLRLDGHRLSQCLGIMRGHEEQKRDECATHIRAYRRDQGKGTRCLCVGGKNQQIRWLHASRLEGSTVPIECRHQKSLGGKMQPEPLP